MVALVDVEDGQEAEQEGFEHGRVVRRGGRGSERQEQGPEIRRQLGQRERARSGGVEEQGECFEEEREQRRGCVWETCSAADLGLEGGLWGGNEKGMLIVGLLGLKMDPPAAG